MTQIRSSLRAIALGAVVATIPSAATGQAEHRNLSGERVAVYNLAGRVRVQAATGSQVTVDVTRGGRDASKLKLETGERSRVELLCASSIRPTGSSTPNGSRAGARRST